MVLDAVLSSIVNSSAKITVVVGKKPFLGVDVVLKKVDEKLAEEG